MNVFVI